MDGGGGVGTRTAKSNMSKKKAIPGKRVRELKLARAPNDDDRRLMTKFEMEERGRSDGDERRERLRGWLS